MDDPRGHGAFALPPASDLVAAARGRDRVRMMLSRERAGTTTTLAVEVEAPLPSFLGRGEAKGPPVPPFDPEGRGGRPNDRRRERRFRREPRPGSIPRGCYVPKEPGLPLRQSKQPFGYGAAPLPSVPGASYPEDLLRRPSPAEEDRLLRVFLSSSKEPPKSGTEPDGQSERGGAGAPAAGTGVDAASANAGRELELLNAQAGLLRSFRAGRARVAAAGADARAAPRGARESQRAPREERRRRGRRPEVGEAAYNRKAVELGVLESRRAFHHEHCRGRDGEGAASPRRSVMLTREESAIIEEAKQEYRVERCRGRDGEGAASPRRSVMLTREESAIIEKAKQEYRLGEAGARQEWPRRRRAGPDAPSRDDPLAAAGLSRAEEAWRAPSCRDGRSPARGPTSEMRPHGRSW